jgi:hypothetical protein
VAPANADDLYGLPLEQFVPERAALAKALRADGDKDEAARVAKLAKPSVAAWAVNQLVRTQGKAITELFDAGDALIDAQSALVSGSGDAAALRDAAQREREMVDELVGTARGLLGSSGNELSQTMLDRISDTLNAAALDEDARDQVRQGTLVRELKHVGFAGVGGFGAAPPAAPSQKKKSGETRPATGSRATKKAGGREAARDVREAARRAEKERADELRAAKHAEADTRRAAELAERKLAGAEERRDRAAAALEQAEEELKAARRHAKETAAAHDEAASRLSKLQTDGR